MFAANSHVIREATPDDTHALRRLAQLDSQRPLAGQVLIGELQGRPAAAISLVDGRVIADPFRPTGQLTPLLRIRAGALRAYMHTPSLSARMRAAMHPRTRAASAKAA
jgi:hypothetical protein